MSIYVKNRELYKIFLSTKSVVTDQNYNMVRALKVFLDQVSLARLDTAIHDKEVYQLVNALINGEEVEFTEPKYYAYILIPVRGAGNAVQILRVAGSYGSTYVNTNNLSKGPDYEFTQSDIDELEEKYPYVQIKGVNDNED